MQKFLIVDGMALIFRAFYAIRYEMKTSSGMPTNAVYGFTSMLLNALINEKPDFVALTFDLAAPTFRAEEYTEYKAQREKAPDELYEQIPLCKKLVECFEIPIFQQAGYEADDLIGTLSKHAAAQGIQSSILTGDMDLLQLVDEHTHVLAPQNGGGDLKVYHIKDVHEKWGIAPFQVPDFKGLCGDASDNIPGVKGIGKKTAEKLLNEYTTLEGIYENLESIKGSVHDKLANDKEMAFLSKKLATIHRNVEVDFSISQCKTIEFDKACVTKLFDELEFKATLRKKLSQIKTQKEINKEKAEAELQPSLF